jgi:hypothetical protein
MMETNNHHPESLIWQGREIFFMATKLLTGLADAPMLRYAYGIDGHVVMYFFDNGNGVDWEKLERENCAAPDGLTERDLPNSPYNRTNYNHDKRRRAKRFWRAANGK